MQNMQIGADFDAKFFMCVCEIASFEKQARERDREGEEDG